MADSFTAEAFVAEAPVVTVVSTDVDPAPRDRRQRTALVIDGDAQDRESLAATFREAAFRVHAVGEGDTGLMVAHEADADIVVLNLDLPQMSGAEVMREIRASSTVPILVVTARRGEVERIRALDLGADDVLVKPVSAAELMAHVRALLRRVSFEHVGAPAGNSTVRFGDCTLHLDSHVLRRDGVTIPLRPQERRLLEFLACRPGRTFTRAQILDAIWGGGGNITIRTVDVHVRWLREKIEDDPSTPQHLQTVRGIGYRFDLEP